VLSEGLLVLDRDGRVVMTNAAAEQILRTPRDDLVHRSLRDPSWRTSSPDGRPFAADEYAFAVAFSTRRPVFGIEQRVDRSDGTPVLLTVNAAPLLDPDGMVSGAVVAFTDQTQERRLEDRLRDSETRYRTLVEQIPAITYIDLVDEHMTTSYISPQVEELLGLTAQEWIGEPDLWYRHLHPDDRERALAEYLDGRDRGGPFSLEYRMLGRQGQVVWFRDDALVVNDSSGRPSLIHGVMLNITERKRAEEQVAFLAYHDSLTGLPNRTMFEELLVLALARARAHGLGVAVLCLDLDNFKMVNDSLGHAAGDELLRQVAARLREATRETDLVARQGGDEFLLLLADLDREGRGTFPDGLENSALIAESVVGRIEEALAAPFTIEGQQFFITSSIGISLFPADASEATELLRNADAAMYGSKRDGVGGYRIYSKGIRGTVDVLSLAGRLRRAVEREQWVLYYQPIVDLLQDAIVGAEALIRWQDPNGGLVPPGEFIPLAEEMGLIEAIGDWVFGEIGRQARAWRADGLEMQISFNLSPRQLRQPDLVRKLLGRLEEFGVDPRMIIMEITESMAMTDPERTLRVLQELNVSGIRVAIDDFGTGYSSLSRLKHLPVDILKIDRSFIRDIPADEAACSMVRAIVELAHGLRMEPHAEGIEQKVQWDFLVDLQCQRGQGYYFSRAVPAEEITDHWRLEGFASPRLAFRSEYGASGGLS
jgi:diguanylate cyclase (GGDEF)-like protein/PAS domain S-box-containing protein